MSQSATYQITYGPGIMTWNGAGSGGSCSCWADMGTYIYNLAVDDYGSSGMRILYDGTIYTDGTIQADNGIYLGGSNEELRFYEGLNYISFEAPALTTNTNYVWPNADGGYGEVLMTDGSGNLTWTSVVTGSCEWQDDGTTLTTRDANRNVQVDGDFNAYGTNIRLGNAITDRILVISRFTGDINPATDSTYSLGSSIGPIYWLYGFFDNLYLNNTAWFDGATAGAIGVNNDFYIRGASNELRFYEGANYISFAAPALTSNTSYVWPPADGNFGEMLTTLGTGQLTWTATVTGNGDDYVYKYPATAARNVVQAVADVVPLTIRNSIGGTASLINLEDDTGTLVAEIDEHGFHNWYLPADTIERDPFMVVVDGCTEEVWQTRVISRGLGDVRGQEIATTYAAPTDNLADSGGAWFRFVGSSALNGWPSASFGIAPTDHIGFHGWQNCIFIGSDTFGIGATLLPIVFGMQSIEKCRLDTSGNFCLTGGASGVNNDLRFYEGVNYVGFKAPTLTADQIWVLPDADGSANEAIITDGAGNLSFGSPTPAAHTIPFHSDVAFTGPTNNDLIQYDDPSGKWQDKSLDEICDGQTMVFDGVNSNGGAFSFTTTGTVTFSQVVQSNLGLYIGGSNNELRFYEGVNYVGFEAPALTGNQIWVLPASDGANGDHLCTDGAGALTWCTPATGYTDEQAQDAVGNILTDSATIDFTYDDGVPSITAIVKTDSINDTHIDWGTGANQVSAIDVPITDTADYFNSTEVESALAEAGKIHYTTSEPGGFPNRTTTSLSWDDGTYTLTMSATGFSYWYKGKEYTKTSDTVQVTDATNLYWIYIDPPTNNLVSSTSLPGWEYPIVATVYWNTTINKGLVGEERHGIVMDYRTHDYLHDTVGTRYESGLNGTFNTPSATNPNISISSGIIDDEDLSNSIGTQSACNVLYKNGSANFEWDTGATYYKKVSNILQYNNGNNLADVDNNKYVAYWIFATNDITIPIISLMGQRQDTVLADARNNNKYESLTLGTLPYKEMKLLYRVLLQRNGTDATYIEAQDLRSISNLPAGTYVATDHAALTGLTTGNAGHTQFLMADGTTPLTGNWAVGGFDITGIDDLSVGGNTDLGNAATDTVTFNADIDSNIVPAAGTETIGVNTDPWDIGYFDELVMTAEAGAATEGRLWNDSTQQQMQTYVAGLEETLEGTIFTSTQNVNIKNDNTEKTLISTGVGTVTLPANWFVIGKSIRMVAGGFFSTKASLTGSLTIRFKAGATVLFATAAFTPTSSMTNQEWYLDAILTCYTTGGSGNFWGQGKFLWTDTGTRLMLVQPMVMTSTVTLNTAASQAINLTAQWATADSSNSITQTNILLEQLN